MRSQSDFMRRESKPSTEIPSTFVVHKFYTVMNDNEQKELSYHRVQQMIQDQIVTTGTILHVALLLSSKGS